MKKAITIILLLVAIVLIFAACKDVPDVTTTTKAPPITNSAEIMEIKLIGAKTSFDFTEEFNSDDLVVSVILTDGTERMLTKEDYTVSKGEYNSMRAGTYTATVKIIGTNLAQSYEVKVNPANKLKVLMIGNSFADDTINYAHEIAKSIGIPEENILVADIYIGGCVLNTHWANAQSNAPAYRFGLEREGWFDGSSYTNWTMEQAIKYADWDFITFQQGSSASGDPSSFSNLQNLMDYVYDIATDEENNPNANPDVKFVWHQTWAYQQGTTAAHFSKYNFDQMTMYNGIVSCIKNFVLNKNFVAIIPNGTAIQNARTSSYGDNFSRDQHNHLSYDAGRYIAAMNLVSVLTGRDMSNLTWKPTDSGFNYPLTEKEIEICKESVANAIANPLEITKSKYPAAPTDLSSMFEGEGTEANPYLIQSADDMWALSNYTKGKSFTDKNTYFKLTADIDLSAENWRPISSSAEAGWVSVQNGNANSFNGNFDGNGKTITFVGNYTGDTWAKGLFGAIGGYVHDLTLRGSITTEKGKVGSLAAMAITGAKIENITSYVDITAGNNQVGGIIGYIESDNVTLTNCKNYGTITARELVGGILGGGYKNTQFINCENHGDVTATLVRAGGIAGEKFPVATFTNCTNTGTVMAGGVEATSNSGTSSNYAGYLFGEEK
ncbi:MAG: DUF4886 domain-containing protein [Clostridia bacterium]|nr:DUF4886 domain-containing protein [Clostridia bacterium]